MKRLTRQGAFFVLLVMFLVIVILGVIFVPKNNKEEEKTKTTIVKEDVVLKCEYIDSIGNNVTSDSYDQYDIVIYKDEEVLDYVMSKEQYFSKYIKYDGPKDETLITDGKDKVTHYIYCSVLTGDILKVEGEETSYEIGNARITYDKIPVIIDSDEHTITYTNQDRTKTKTLTNQEFINKLNNEDQRKEILEW